MSQSKNWKAYYSGDFTQFDLTVEGEVQAEKTLTVEPDILEHSTPFNPTFFHVQYFNAGTGDFKKVHRTFKVPTADLATVVIFNEDGKEETTVPLSQDEKQIQQSSAEGLTLHKAEWDLRPKTKLLHISGTVIVNAPDDKITLKRAMPQGINPTILIMILEIESGGGPMKRQPKEFTHTEFTSGAEPWKIVHVRSEYGGDSIKINRITS